MTIAELRSAVRDHLVKTSTDLPDATVDIFLSTVVDEMLNAHDWKLKQETTATFTYGSSTDGYTLPSDFVADEGVYIVTSGVNPDSKREPVLRVDGGRAAWAARFHAVSWDEQYPTPGVQGYFYFLWATKLYVVPNPTSTLDFELDYLKDLTTLGDTHPFVVTYPRTLLAGGLREAYLWNHEEERAALHDGRFKVLLDAAKKRDTGTRMAGAGKRVKA